MGLGMGAIVGEAGGVGPENPMSIGSEQQYQHTEAIPRSPIELKVSEQYEELDAPNSQHELGLHMRKGFSMVVQSMSG